MLTEWQVEKQTREAQLLGAIDRLNEAVEKVQQSATAALQQHEARAAERLSDLQSQLHTAQEDVEASRASERALKGEVARLQERLAKRERHLLQMREELDRIRDVVVAAGARTQAMDMESPQTNRTQFSIEQ